MTVTYDNMLSRTLDDSIGVLNAFRSCLLNMSDKRVKLTLPGFVFLFDFVQIIKHSCVIVISSVLRNTLHAAAFVLQSRH